MLNIFLYMLSSHHVSLNEETGIRDGCLFFSETKNVGELRLGASDSEVQGTFLCMCVVFYFTAALLVTPWLSDKPATFVFHPPAPSTLSPTPQLNSGLLIKSVHLCF